MKEKTYKIRPLEWEITKDKTEERYRAHVPMGSYTVRRMRHDFEETNEWESWKWEYCFDEYYDESYGDCESLEDGKKKAYQDWLSRIMPALIEVKNKK